jgi:hypothetical protein
MNYIGYIIPPLTVALIMLFVNRWLNHREKRKSALEIMKEEMIGIKSMLEGHKSFTDTLNRHDTEIEIRREVCETNHKRWDGKDRRQVI